MAKKKKTAKKAETSVVNEPLKYKQITAEIVFTDGGIETATFYRPSECFRYIERTVGEHYADSVRVELF